MLKKLLSLCIFSGLAFILIANVALAESNEQVNGENPDAEINKITVVVNPKKQHVQGSTPARWTITAAHNNGRLSIAYSLKPGDGKTLRANSFNNSYSFTHKYDPSGLMKTFNVTAQVAYDYGIDSDTATVTWVY